MLYLAHPNGALSWNDLPVSIIDELTPGEQALDLARLAWRPAKETATGTTVRLALRFGVLCTGGIVFSSRLLLAEHRPAELQKGIDHTRGPSSTLRAEDQLMALVDPGWKDRWEEQSARIVASLRGQLHDAEANLAELLEAPADPALVTHWRSIGGVQSDPVGGHADAPGAPSR
jgi:hypothetical protein